MRRTSMWAATLLVLCPFLCAQQAAQQTRPPLPAEVLGPQLVAWSELQKPQPVPQPMPQQQAQSPGSQSQEPSSQAFTGTIVKDGSKYVLQVSETTSYQIDDQEKAKAFEGKQVKIAGSLDAETKVLHVTSIEPVS